MQSLLPFVCQCAWRAQKSLRYHWSVPSTHTQLDLHVCTPPNQRKSANSNQLCGHFEMSGSALAHPVSLSLLLSLPHASTLHYVDALLRRTNSSESSCDVLPRVSTMALPVFFYSLIVCPSWRCRLLFTSTSCVQAWLSSYAYHFFQVSFTSTVSCREAVL